jgi:hypothetical protein
MGEEMEFSKLNANRKKSVRQRVRLTLHTLVVLTFVCAAASSVALAQPKSFSSPEEAVEAAVTAARNNNEKEMVAIFGSGAKELLFSADAVADKQRREEFLVAYAESHRLVTEGQDTILLVGKQDWPLPIPLVKRGNAWVFNIEKGKEEILNRRIGENELYTIQTLLAVVDAQREYAMEDRDGDGLLEYAQKFVSDPGKKNGLYWEAKPGERQSPLGPIMARARSEGYKGQASTATSPYHGYYYRILTAQGKNAPGGAYSYIVKGKMIGGFAVVAYPAEYGNSGVMTFVVNHDGNVFQKDLGKNTVATGRSMKEYNVDSTWSEIRE